MGRIYAGVLAPLALVTLLAHGWLGGQDVEATLWTAWYGLVAFAAVGYVIGRVAEFVVEDSVRSQVAGELASREAAQRNVPMTSASAENR